MIPRGCIKGLVGVSGVALYYYAYYYNLIIPRGAFRY